MPHPNIATLYDFTEHDGQLCIVMEYVEGFTLAQLIRTRGPMPIRDALPIILQLAEAVAYLHSQKIVHRDLAAANIKVSPDGVVKLLDFGIASLAGSRTLSSAGTITGTFEYLAPEQIAGGTADQRSDIWSLGILLYEMFTGRLPFEADSTPELCRRIQTKDFSRAPLRSAKVSPRFEALIMRCLEKIPAKRFQSLAELQHALRSQTSSFPLNFFPLLRQRRLLFVLAGSALLALFAALLLTSSARSPMTSSPVSSTDGVKSLDIDAVDGPAEVYRNGQDLGETPVHLNERWGQHVSLVLKRSGYSDLPVDFDVDEPSSYSYVLQPSTQSVP